MVRVFKNYCLDNVKVRTSYGPKYLLVNVCFSFHFRQVFYRRKRDMGLRAIDLEINQCSFAFSKIYMQYVKVQFSLK